MKNNCQVFDEHLEKLESLVEEGKFYSCLNICHHLSVYSAMADYRDGLLVSETLEGIFAQLGSEFDKYNIPSEEKQQIFQKVRGTITDIENSYKNDDKNRVYNALSEGRHAATLFQLKCWNTFPRKTKMLGRRVQQE